MNIIIRLSSLVVLSISAALSPAALAQGNDKECARLDGIRMSSGPSSGALAALEHSVAVTSAAIAMIDLPCGAPFIVSTDQAEVSRTRAELYQSWKTARAGCLQLTAGARNYDDLPDSSPCKGGVSPQ